MADRRTLCFSRLEEVMPDVDRLLEGYTTAGPWSLGMICNHLGSMLQGSVEGFSVRVPWLARARAAWIGKRTILRSGHVPEIATLSAELAPRPGLDDRAEAEALRAALRFYALHDGPMAGHPLLGKLTRADWDRLHCIQSAHHLSFARPA